jgi:AcrR family transcriptional regulator
MAQAHRPESADRSQRRTQSERSAETREKVIQAVVECIAEQGLSNTTAVRIAERAGVTWGAIAHQFGDKESVLLAALERSIENMGRDLESLAVGHESARARVSLLVDETWKRLNDPELHAFLEILLNSRTHPDPKLRSRYEDVLESLTARIWEDLFAEFGLDSRSSGAVRNLTFSALLGLAILAMVWPQTRSFTHEIETLKRGVVRMLQLEMDR